MFSPSRQYFFCLQPAIPAKNNENPGVNRTYSQWAFRLVNLKISLKKSVFLCVCAGLQVAVRRLWAGPLCCGADGLGAQSAVPRKVRRLTVSIAVELRLGYTGTQNHPSMFFHALQQNVSSSPSVVSLSDHIFKAVTLCGQIWKLYRDESWNQHSHRYPTCAGVYITKDI